MSFVLDRHSVSELIEYVDRSLRASGCDHSHRFSAAWAKEREVNWDDLLDSLEATGAFCDCEVVLNLEEGPLLWSPPSRLVDRGNRWLLPPNVTDDLERT